MPIFISIYYTWCFNGECIAAGIRPNSASSWSSWTVWSVCSRTCGGGVQRRERICNIRQPAKEANFCIGSAHEYQICNTDICDESKPQFRDVQCYRYQSSLFHGELHKWKSVPPPETEDNLCSLFCINENDIIVKKASRVLDGTRCRPGSKNTCIHGKCYKVGCDWKINSEAVEDVCGICNGNGSFCNIVIINERKFGEKGLEKITLLKKGVRHIAITKQEPSVNKIAVASVNETFYLNGYFRVSDSTSLSDDIYRQPPGRYIMGENVTGIYTMPEQEREELHIYGPLTEDLLLYVVFLSPGNINVRISFIELYDHPVYEPSYQWNFVSWKDCSVRCGGGVKISQPSCTEKRDGVVSDKYCSSIDIRPEPRVSLCNLQPCKTRWKVWKWSECSGCLFVPGIHKRMVECVKESRDFSKSDEVIVSSSDCCGPPPLSIELCFSIKPCKNSTSEEFISTEISCPVLTTTVNSENTWPTLQTCLNNIGSIENKSVISSNENVTVVENLVTNVINMNNSSPRNRQRRFHLLPFHKTSTKTSQTAMYSDSSFQPNQFTKSNINREMVKTIENLSRMNNILFIAHIEKQTDLGLSETDMEQIGDHIPKFVISGDIMEFSGEEADDYLKVIRKQEKNSNFSIIDYINSKIRTTQAYCT